MNNSSKKPALLLLPNLLGEHRHHELFLPASVDKAVSTLDGLIAESEQAGRRFLSRFQTKKPAHHTPLCLYHRHTPDDEIDFILEPVQKGERWGLIADSGLPCIADPGAKLVRRARLLGIEVKAFIGPSSLFLALMLSGLSAQSFTFHGYLDKDLEKLKGSLIAIERQSRQTGGTQMFMERPYRNPDVLEALVNTLSGDTVLCIAWELTMPEQGVLTQTVSAWKKSPLPNLRKKNALFLFNAEVEQS
ncbi:MAG: SAM-dependent methyltransferase [Waddliaceae bacterium]